MLGVLSPPNDGDVLQARGGFFAPISFTVFQAQFSGTAAQPLSIELTAVSGLVTTGISRRTGAGTWTAGTTVTVPEGGTGAVTLTGLVKGTGTTAMVPAVSATDYVAPSAYASSNGLTLSTAKLLGRTTAATGAAEEISIGAGLALSAGVLSNTGSGAQTVVNPGGLIGVLGWQQSATPGRFQNFYPQSLTLN